MKYLWKLIAAGILLLGATIALIGTVRDPADFTGKWYYTEDGSAYLFHNGIIISEKHHLNETDAEIFSGAYSFGKNSIVLFFLTEAGVEQVQKLQLVSRSDGDILCASSECGETVVFCRNKEAYKNK